MWSMLSEAQLMLHMSAQDIYVLVALGHRMCHPPVGGVSEVREGVPFPLPSLTQPPPGGGT